MRNVPKLRFRAFDGEWTQTRLGDISSGVGYGIGSAATAFDGTNKYLRITDIDESSRRFSPNPLTSPEGNIDSKYILKEGDIVFARTGASTGKSYLYNSGDGKLVYAGFLIKFHVDQADPYFIYLNTFRGSYAYWVKVMSVRSGQPGINAEEYKLLPVSLPSLKEQQKIAAFLTAVDTKIEQLSKKEQLLKQYKKGVMQKIFSQAIRFRADDGSEFPKWETNKLSVFMEERRTQAPKSDAYPLMAFIAYKGIAEKGDRYNREFLVNDEGGKKYKQTEYGDFIYSSNNLEVGSIGLNTYGNASISPVYSIFKIKEKFNERFISNYLVRREFLNKMVRYRQGVVYGQWRIHEKDFLKIEERIPSWDEQNKIAHFLGAIDDKVSQIASQLEAATTFKKGLLQQMFV